MLADSVPHMMWTAGPNGAPDFWNRRGGEYTGAASVSPVGWNDLIHPDDLDQARTEWAVAILTGGELVATYRLRRRDGEFRWHSFRAWAARRADGVVLKWIGEATDIDDLVTATAGLHRAEERSIDSALVFEARLRQQALTDQLTGLPNRQSLFDQLDQKLLGANESSALAVMMISLDRLGIVNDGLGRAAGDQVLLAVATRIQHELGAADVVARSSGCEFVVLGDMTAADAMALAQQISGAVSQPIEVGDQTVVVTTSIGMVRCAGRDCVAEDLIREAAQAAAKAKRQGGRRCIMFSSSSSRTEARARFDLEIDLRQAIDHAELRVDYQPTVDLTTGRMTGAEALLRWDHPRRGSIAPLDFIPVAEENQLIVPIGSWVLGRACEQLSAWQRALGPLAPQSLSVNVSGRQLERGDLAQLVADLLVAHELDPSNLCLEITESVLMDNAPGTIDALRDLRDLGVRLSVDDFGTGYSSLLYLRDFPVDELKIDRLFVAGLGRNRDDTAIVEGVIALAHGLNLTVVAEGVETHDQAESLRHLGSDVGQGYFWSPPAGGDQIAELLTSSDGAPDWPVFGRRSVIDVRSAPGGATDVADGPHGSGRTDEAVSTRYRVLLIDDARPERELLALWLRESTRFEVIGEAGDGARGVALAAELEPDLVVLDMSMPGMDGIQALREISAVSPRSKVVILSGFMSTGLVTATTDLGASACIDKSVGPARLVEELLGTVETAGAAAR